MGNKSKYKPDICTASRRKQCEDKTLAKMMVLVLAYLMEEQEFTEPDRLIQFYDSMVRWWMSIKGNEISISTVKKLVEEHTGREVIF